MTDVLPLHSERLTFRRLTEADIEAMHSYQSREDYARYAWRGPRTREDVESMVAEHSGERAWTDSGDHVRYGISPRGSTELAGEIVLTLVDAPSRQVEIGWALHPEHTGRGYASEAALTALDAAFDLLGAHRVFARLDSLNTASVKVCERIGMRLEATLRESHHQLGEWRDELIYALLAAERSEPGARADAAEPGTRADAAGRAESAEPGVRSDPAERADSQERADPAGRPDSAEPAERPATPELANSAEDGQSASSAAHNQSIRARN